MGETPRSKDIARAALLRERIVSAIKASNSGMTMKQLLDWTSIAELYHGNMLPGKVRRNLAALISAGVLESVGSRYNRTFFMKKKQEGEKVSAFAFAQPAPETQHLQLEVSKSQHTVSFVFEGLQITVKVLP